MDTRRALLLLLVICTINADISTDNGDRPNNIRRVRRISEYLVPPPPPRFHPLNRIPRANYQSYKEPGYLARLVSWMNPWWSTFTLPSPPPSTTTYIGPPPVDYEKPPPSSNDNSGYAASKKTENCNACNTVPWIPLEQNQHLKDAFSLLRNSPQRGGYISKEPHSGQPDAYHAASHEVQVSDFSFPLNAKDDSKSALPNPQLYFGGLAPLYKAEHFDYSPQVTPDENSEYFGAQTSVSGNGAPTRNNSPLTEPVFNDGHNGQSVYPDSDLSSTGVVFQKSGYTNPNANNEEHFHQNHVTSDGANSVPDKQGLENLHVYPGTLPPFFKEKTFNYSPQVTPDENSEYLGTTSVSGNGALTKNNSPLTGPVFNDGHNGQSVYPDSDLLSTKVTFQNSGYTNPNVNNGEHYHQNHAPNGSFINELPNPQVYPGALPPLHKVKDFNYSPQVTPDKNSEYPDTTSVSGNGAPTENNSPLTQPAFNDGHNGQFVYPDSDLSGTGVVFQESEYTNPNANNGEHFQQNLATSDGANFVLDKQGLENLHVYPGPLPPFFKEKNFNYSPQVTPDENSKYLSTLDGANSIPDKQELKGSSINSLFASMNHQKFYNNYGILNDQPSEESANKEPYYTTGSNGSNNFLDASQANQNLPSYEISNLDQIPDYHRYNSRGPLLSDDSMNGNIEESIILASPLQDLSLKDENRTHSSSLPPTFDANSKNATEIPDDIEDTLNYGTDVTPEQQDGKRKQVQVIIPYTSDYTPLPFHPSYEKNISDVDNYVGAESKNTVNVVKPPNSPIFQSQPTTLQPTTLQPTYSIFSVNKKPVPNNTRANNSIDPHKLQRNIDNWTIQKYSGGTTASTVSPIYWNNPYLSPFPKTIPKEYFTTTEPIDHVTNSYKDTVKTFTLAGFSFNDKEHNESANRHIEEPRVQVIENLTTKSPIATPITEKNMWQNFPVGISSVNKERVYIVTPQPQFTSRSYSENRKQKTLKEAENNTKEVSDIKKMDTNKSDTFESIEKAYQVLPQAVNNLAVASTGPESAPMWGIMEHDDFASSVESIDSEYDSNNTKLPIYSRLSKESRARR